MKPLHPRILFVLITLTLAVSAAAQVPQYVDLTPGTVRFFHSLTNPSQDLRQWVTQETENYSIVRYDSYVGAHFVAVYEWLWQSVDDTGDVWTHGINGNECTPAFKSLDVPLAVGNTWEATVEYGLLGPIHFSYECTAEEDVTVPQGTFHCFVVRCDWTLGDVTGTAERWYCDGPGMVKWVRDDGVRDFELITERTLNYMNLDTTADERFFRNASDPEWYLVEGVRVGTEDYVNVRMDFFHNEIHSVRHDYYMSSDDEGDVWWHGRDDQVLDPVIPFVDAPLYVGKSWEGSGVMFGDDREYMFSCIDEETISVPAGQFHCFVVHEDIYVNAVYSGYTETWYCEGIGKVKWVTSVLGGSFPDGVWELEEWPEVPVEDVTPSVTLLPQNYPNPFNPQTTIAYSLLEDGPVELAIYDVVGRRVRILVAGKRQFAGEHRVVWDGRNDEGFALPSGAYIYRMATADAEASRSMTLVR